jgi:hypothetical protein
MTRVRLVSSVLASAGYDPTTRVLEIEFASGAVYHYLDVPRDVYWALFDAPSQGRLFHNRIRGAFEYRCVTDEVSAQ